MILNKVSILDIWSMKEYGVPAIQLVNTPYYDKLVTHIMKLCDSDVDYWKPRNTRMEEAQKMWDLGYRRGGSMEARNSLVSKNTAETDVDVQNAEIMELNDGYLIVDKISAMVDGADWHINVPPIDPSTREVAQRIEDFLTFTEEELNAKHGLSLNGTLTHDEAHYAALRGWITGLVIPDPTDTRLPIRYVLEDPMFVYPRYGSDSLLRVTHRYTITALEAVDQFESVMEFFADKKDDDTIEVTTYYDSIYKITIVSEGANLRNTSGFNRRVVEPLVAHGYVDFDGVPINPWIIVTPRGTPTRRSLNSSKDTVSMIGLDVIHPVKDIILKLEKLSSMMMTEVAKGQNPPHIIYHQPGMKPERLDFGIGAENYLLLNDNRVEPINTTVMKPDANPLMELLVDRLQRGSISSVLFGNSGSAMAGYAINLLSKGAEDAIRPIMNGMRLYRELRYRRMLEMYVTHGAQMVGAVQYRATNRTSGQTTTGNSFSPDDIMLNGVYVSVDYHSTLPTDKAQMMASAVAGVNSGLLSRYDARKDWLDIARPKETELHILEELNYQDPEMLQELRLIAAERSGDPLLQEAAQRVQQKQMMMMQVMRAQANQQAVMDANGVAMEKQKMAEKSSKGRNKKSPIEGMDSSVLPPAMQPGSSGTPANIDPIGAATQQLNDVSALQSGGTLPNMV